MNIQVGALPDNTYDLARILAAKAVGSVTDYKTSSTIKFDSGEFKKATERWIEAYETISKKIVSNLT